MPTFNAEKIISELQQESKATELDLSGYTLPDEKATLSNKPLATLTGHNNTVSALAVLPDGRFISGSYKEIKLWSGQGHCLKTLEHNGSVLALAVLPDGHFISGSNDKSIKLWGSQGNCLQTLTGHKSGVCALVVLPDGRFISGSADNSIKMWDKQGNCFKTLTGHSGHINALVMLPDSCFISGSDDKSIKIWNSQGSCLKTLTGHKSTVSALAVLPDGHFISGSHDSSIKLWDGQGNCLKTLTGINATVVTLTVLPDGRFLSGSSDNTIKLWDGKGQCLTTLTGHENSVTALTMLPDGRLISGSYDNTIKLWDTKLVLRALCWTEVAPVLAALASQRQIQKLNLQKLKLDDNDVLSLLKTLQAASGLKQIDIRETAISATGVKVLHQGLPNLQILHHHKKEEKAIESSVSYSVKYDTAHHENQVRSLTVLNNGHVVSGSGNETNGQKGGCINVWDANGNFIRGWRNISTTTGIVNQVLSLHSWNNQIISGSEDGEINIWDTQSNRVRTLRGHTGIIWALAMLPNTQRLASASQDKTIKLWDFTNGKLLKTLEGHGGEVLTLAVLGDGYMASAGAHDGNRIRIWDIDSRSSEYGRSIKEKELHGHTGHVCALRALGNGFLASGSCDNTIKIWDLRTWPWKCSLTLEGHTNYVSDLDVLSNGYLVSASADYTVRIWNLDNGKCLQIVTAHNNVVYKAAVLPTGRIASASADQTIKIWDSLMPAIRDSIIPQSSSLSVGQRDDKNLDNKNERKEEKIENLRDGFAISYIINYGELELGKKLGQGGFGAVYQATWRFQNVAVKQLLNQKPSSEVLEEFTNEARTMARLRASNVVQFYGYCENPNYCLVMEYMPKGSLYNVLHDNKQTLDWSIRYQLVSDIACGLAFLHAENILHRDIKSLNVLLDDQYHAKLTDFGLSRLKKETKTSIKNAAGTIQWMAPELFKRGGKYNQKSDVYSLGITFWEIASSRIPFDDAESTDVIPNWVKDGERPGEVKEDDSDLKLKDCPKKISSLIRFCWQGNPDKRPEAANIVKYLKSQSEDFASFDPQVSNSNTAQTERKESSNPTPTSAQSSLSSAPHYRSNLVSEQAAPSLRK